MISSNTCDRERLRRLLEDSLPEAAERDVAAHVASCAACQRELETLAAGAGWWDEASQRLSGLNENILPVSEAHAADGDRDEDERRAAGPSGADAHFATDFAVDFLEPSDDPAMLGRLGEYEIVAVIGRGGMGIVLNGFQKELHRHVAVKVLAPHLASSGAARRRFAREAQATAAIVHPHVMAIHSVNAQAKLPYLVMPLVACESLQDRLDRQGPLDLKDVLRIGRQAALGLAAAHAQGIVHRDVKPGNILLETNVDRVMLTDFGLARAVDDATLTRTGIIAGTPQYMSPEQANGDPVDHRSDLFSLGSVLYAMCAGRPPFRAETTFGVLRRIREVSPRPIREINADVPQWLETIVFNLLSKHAADRIGTATEVAALMEQCLAHVQQPTAVALPDVIAEWGLVSVETELNTKSMARAVARPWARWLSLVAVALIAISPVLVLFSRQRQTTADPVKGSTTEPAAADPLLRWDEIQTELDSAASVIDSIESDAERDLNSIDRTSVNPENSGLKEDQ